MTPEKFLEHVTPYIRQSVKREDIDLPLLASILQTRTEVFNDVPEMVDFIDALPDYDNSMYCHKKMKTNEETSLEALKAVLPVLEALEDWNAESIHKALFDLIAKLEVKNGWLLWPVRTAVSGKQFTPRRRRRTLCCFRKRRIACTNPQRYRKAFIMFSLYCHIILL